MHDKSIRWQESFCALMCHGWFGFRGFRLRIVVLTLFQSAQKRSGMNAQDARGLGFVVAGQREHFLYVLLLKFAKGNVLMARRREVPMRGGLGGRVDGRLEVADLLRK